METVMAPSECGLTRMEVWEASFSIQDASHRRSSSGRGGGQQGDVVALALEFGGEGVVAEATAAIHSRGAGCEREDSHRGWEAGMAVAPSLVRGEGKRGDRKSTRLNSS